MEVMIKYVGCYCVNSVLPRLTLASKLIESLKNGVDVFSYSELIIGLEDIVLSIDSLIKGLTSDKNSVLSGVQNVGYMTAMELLHLTSKSVELLVSRQQLYFVKN